MKPARAGQVERIALLESKVRKLKVEIKDLNSCIAYHQKKNEDRALEIEILQLEKSNLQVRVVKAESDSKYDASMSERYTQCRVKCDKLAEQVKELAPQAANNEDLKRRVAEWEKAKREQKDLHKSSSKENVELRREKTRLLLVMTDVAECLKSFKGEDIEVVCRKLLACTGGR